MESKRWYTKPEMIVAMSALLMSLITTIVSVYSAYIDRQYARASVWPRLEIYRSFKVDEFSYGVTNSGNGPAIIEYATIRYRSEPIRVWKDLPIDGNFVQSHLGSRILSAQNTIQPLHYTGEAVQQLIDIDNELSIELCYCSIYEECWVTQRTNEVQAVERCEVDEQDKFLE